MTADRELVDLEDLHHWSVETLTQFWHAVRNFGGIVFPTPAKMSLDSISMPGARRIEGARINFARHLFRHAGPAQVARRPSMIADDERGRPKRSTGERGRQGLRRLRSRCSSAA